MAVSRIVQLAKEIEANATKLDNYLGANNAPQPSFEEDGPLMFPPGVAATQEALSEALDELWWLNQGPIQTVVAKSFATSVGLKFILRYNVQDLVPLEGSTSFQEVADKIRVPVGKVRRLLRFAIADRFFREPQPGRVKHTLTTKVLAQMPVLARWCQMGIYEVSPAKMHMVDAVAKWPASEEPEHSGFSLANNTDKAMFDFLQDHAERASRFKDGMSFLQTFPGFTNALVIQGFDWASLGEATVVDLGGSHGKVCGDIAREFPLLRFIVQDLPKVIEDVRAKAAPDPSGRVTFMAHDFFEAQPVKDASVFYFRWIFHDWSDKYCVKILRALIPALKPGARILISDKCLEDPGTVSMRQERSNRDSDIVMMAMNNSQERDRKEWEELFRSADARFKLDEVKTMPGSLLALLVLTWD